MNQPYPAFIDLTLDDTPRPSLRRKRDEETVPDFPQSLGFANIGKRRQLSKTSTANRFTSVSESSIITPDVTIIDVVDLLSDSEDDIDPIRGSRFVRTSHVNTPSILNTKRLLQVRSFTRQHQRYQRNDVVEFKDGSFQKIKVIQIDTNGDHILIGPVFTRLGSVSPVAPKKRDDLYWTVIFDDNARDTRLPLYYKGKTLLNEVVQIIHCMEGEDDQDRGLWRRSAKDIRRIRCVGIKYTNEPISDTNCLTLDHLVLYRTTKAEVKRSGELTCRWLDIHIFNNRGKLVECSLERPDVRYSSQLQSEQLHSDWLGATRARALLDHSAPTFADGCCGASGVSYGAKQAGLSLEYAFDHDSTAIDTHSLNFPDCRSLVLDVYNFVRVAVQRDWKVDILHISYPCQAYSPANTHPNPEKDALNQDPVFSLTPLIKALRPRVLTIEQTPGLAQARKHRDWYHTLINQITEAGFSVRIAVLKCAQFGVPQMRKRLFILAAAPGEDLPSMPEPTHTEGDITIQHALETVRTAHKHRSLQNHNVEEALDRMKCNRKPKYDGNTLAKTICTGGSDNYHPSGRRLFTPRELLVLMTFPVRYKLASPNQQEMSLTKARRQAGNAVPPLMAAAVLKAVKDSLQQTDRRRRRHLNLPPEIIELD